MPKLTLVWTLFFGLVVGAASALGDGLVVDPFEVLWSALIAGVSLTTIRAVHEIYRSKWSRIAAELDPERTRRIIVEGRSEDILDQLRHAFGALGVGRFKNGTRPAELIGNTPVSWTTWGEKLTAEVRQQGAECEITITSQPARFNTPAAAPRNVQNLDQIEQLLTSSSGPEGPGGAGVGTPEKSKKHALASRASKVKSPR